MSEGRIGVVGAGVVGLACAWELRRRGADVVVLERGAIGGGTSRGNAGWVSPSFTYPLPAPGMVREGLRQLVTRGEAFVLRPSLDPAFARWLWRFRQSCSPARFDAGVRALLGLNRRTFELFDAYRDAGVAFEMHTAGLVVAARTPGGLDLYRRIFRRLRELGYEGGAIDELDAASLASLEPALARDRVVAGLHARVDRFVRPEELTAGLAERLRADGVEIRAGSELRSLERRDGGWSLELSAGSPLTVGRVVVAAGLSTAPLLRRHGVRVPLAGARGYSVTLAGRGTPPRHALYLAEAKLGLSPFDGGVRIAGVFELGARSADVAPGAGERLLAAARPYLAGWQPESDGPVEAWAGLRPATPDGLPLIGALPGLEGVYLATGHGMLGVTLAPATADLLAPLVLEGRAAPELAPFDPARRL
ncbi:MAG TPA: FAD-dependent oxidoreductase [Solirubrobacteraceae bacterium]|nr:FAD-dependent oxidoreductase [Solirubrobacteraceae bacterium]